MRLKPSEVSTIKGIILAIDPQAEIYLYGSRVDDEKRGGDIDILIMSKIIDFDKKLTISAKLFEAMDEQKVDILVASDASDPFARTVKDGAIGL